MCGLVADFLSGKEEKRRNPDGFQAFLTQSRRKICRLDVCHDLISGSLYIPQFFVYMFMYCRNYNYETRVLYYPVSIEYGENT